MLRRAFQVVAQRARNALITAVVQSRMLWMESAVPLHLRPVASLELLQDVITMATRAVSKINGFSQFVPLPHFARPSRSLGLVSPVLGLLVVGSVEQEFRLSCGLYFVSSVLVGRRRRCSECKDVHIINE